MPKKFIDLTPTWQEILPTWRMMLEAVMTIDRPNQRTGKDPAKVIASFWKEMCSMAEAADKWNEYCRTVDEAAGTAEAEAINEALGGPLPTEEA